MFNTIDELRSQNRMQPTGRRSLIQWAGGVILAVLQFHAIYRALLEVD